MMRTKRSIIGKSGLAALVALLVSACAQDPDFGRYRPTPLERLNAVFSGMEKIDPALPLTNDEIELHRISDNLVSERPVRESGYRFVLPDMKGSTNVAPPSSGYYMRLRERHPTSPSALINALSDDVLADTVMMDQLAPICAGINEADQSRADALVGAPSAATAIALEKPAAFANVRTRLEDNGRLIDITAAALARRLVSYRTALAHARLDAPEAESLATAADAIRWMEESLTLLEREAVRHQSIEAFARGSAI